MKYDVNYFIEKFSNIPNRKWTTHTTLNSKGQRCAWGHLDDDYQELSAFHKLDNEWKVKMNLTPVGGVYTPGNNLFANINNGGYAEYQQPTPKHRILAALNDIKRMTGPSYPDLTKSLAVLPV